MLSKLEGQLDTYKNVTSQSQTHEQEPAMWWGICTVVVSYQKLSVDRSDSHRPDVGRQGGAWVLRLERF